MDFGTILLLATTILPLIFGKRQTPEERAETRETTVTEPARGYQSPMTGLADVTMFESLLRNLGMYGGAGMPGGASYASPYLQEILNMLGPTWTDLLQGYRTGAVPGKASSQLRKLATAAV